MMYIPDLIQTDVALEYAMQIVGGAAERFKRNPFDEALVPCEGLAPGGKDASCYFLGLIDCFSFYYGIYRSHTQEGAITFRKNKNGEVQS